MIKTLKVAAKNSNMFELKKETPAEDAVYVTTRKKRQDAGVLTPAEDAVYVTTQKKRQDAGVFYSPHFPLSFLPQDARVFYVTVA